MKIPQSKRVPSNTRKKKTLKKKAGYILLTNIVTNFKLALFINAEQCILSSIIYDLLYQIGTICEEKNINSIL